tara:strand:+ start:20451 stop:21458 length:1008 start_codon:yes stop_codon:yes gene_type:complete
MTDTSFAEKLKIDITVLVTSIHQREIAIQTANYYSEICSEVIFVDEQQPHLSESDISALKKKNITYIAYRNDNNDYIYQKRLIGAKQSNKEYVVHSNHDERYTFNGLLACVKEFEKDKKLTFCAGQAIAIRKDNSEIYYTRSYKNLNGYQNTREVNERLYYHAEMYAPIAHYAVWKKESYVKTTETTILVHDKIPTKTILDEVIFELAADFSGCSKAISELYWVRNRINKPFGIQDEEKQNIFEITKNKLNIMLKDLDNVQLNVIINNLLNSLPSFRSKSFLEKSIILIKLRMPNIIKKNTKRIEGVDDIYTLLNYNKIKYEKNDLNNLLNSMSL